MTGILLHSLLVALGVFPIVFVASQIQFWWRKRFTRRDPVVSLRQAIMKDVNTEVCAQIAAQVFEDPICQTALIDYRFTKQNEKMTFKAAGLSQLLVQDEKFDTWRQADPKNQQRFVQVIVRLRGLLPDHVHDI